MRVQLCRSIDFLASTNKLILIFFYHDCSINLVSHSRGCALWTVQRAVCNVHRDCLILMKFSLYNVSSLKWWLPISKQTETKSNAWLRWIVFIEYRNMWKDDFLEFTFWGSLLGSYFFKEFLSTSRQSFVWISSNKNSYAIHQALL